MSTASHVPETWELTGDDARETLLATGRLRLLRDSFLRLRASDGFSHARSLAFLATLVTIQGMVALVGLAEAAGDQDTGAFVERVVEGVAGPSVSETIVATIDNARNAGATRRYLPLVLGLVSGLVTTTTAMAQIERALNRLYGVEQDRPVVRRYGRALVMAVSAGALVAASFVAVAIGDSVGEAIDSDVLSVVWVVVRLPLAVLLLVPAVTLLFRWSPRRHQPEFSWMAFGAVLSVIGVFLVTLGLSGVLHLSSTFGETYGPIAGMVALLLWALLSSIAFLFGAAMAAQLEAVRAGCRDPRRDTEVTGGVEPLLSSAP